MDKTKISRSISIGVRIAAIILLIFFFIPSICVSCGAYETKLSAFDAATGITENTTVYAKWLAQVVITYMFNTTEIGSDSVDMGTAYSATKPADFDEIVVGWFTDPELTNAFVDGTTLNANVTLYAKIHQVAPNGVL